MDRRQLEQLQRKHGEWVVHEVLRKARHLAAPELLLELIEVDPEALRRQDTRSEAALDIPLHVAAQYGLPDIVVAILLHLHPDGARALNKFNQLPLHLAAMHSSSSAVVLLLRDAFPECLETQFNGNYLQRIQRSAFAGAGAAQAARRQAAALVDAHGKLPALPLLAEPTAAAALLEGEKRPQGEKQPLVVAAVPTGHSPLKAGYVVQGTAVDV